ncbi:MAG: type II toxin-antitoxin system HicB family antitoxin [Acidobacteriota bacterium]|nr:type II toxin-antitoxin system HicB family antitoxin [Acidobacteriota bacterium]
MRVRYANKEGDPLTLDLSPQTEARLTAKAQESGLSVEAFIEKLLMDSGDNKTSASIGKPFKLPVWHLGARGEFHRRDIYDDER